MRTFAAVIVLLVGAALSASPPVRAAPPHNLVHVEPTIPTTVAP
jgi:hypothetical protein